MMMRFPACPVGLNLVALLLAALLLSPWAMAEDIIHTSDGRVLKGEIIRETDRQIIFRYVDPSLGFEATITLPMSTIEKIERNVQDKVKAPEDPTGGTTTPATTTPSSATDPTATSDAGAQSTPRSEVTTFYVVPMKGQVGTDITERIYEKIIEDIKAKNPDVVIIKLYSSDLRNEYQEGADDIIEGETKHREREEQNQWDKDNIQKVRLHFYDSLPKDMRQVMWVRDAVGSSAIFALAWPEMYMHPEANVGGLSSYVMRYRNAAGDANVRAKFGDAAFGWIRGITQYGDDPVDPNPTRVKLITAMAKPEAMLSVWWRGRMPMWRNDVKGEVVIDDSDEMATVIPAWRCDDLCLTKGTAETLDDLAVLLGERQYELIEGIAETVVTEHHDDWRKAYDQAIKSMLEYQKQMGRISGNSAMGNLRKAENALKRVLMLVRKWPEIGVRTGGQLNEVTLEIMLEKIKRLRRDGGQGAGGSGGRGGSGGGGGLGGR